MSYRGQNLRYRILDPTGNITALVETAVAPEQQPALAAQVMRCHPEVEQVGFVRFAVDVEDEQAPQLSLRMAGGEFCGNATMSAAALWAQRMGVEQACVKLQVSGASRPVEVRLSAEGENAYAGSVLMPPARSLSQVRLSCEGLAGQLPLVALEGISHLIIEPSSPCFCLRECRAQAERAVRSWCSQLETDGLGLMFLSGGEPAAELTPLVYIPGGDTVFWENSCASGSAAVGMCLAARAGRSLELELREPGGTLRVQSDPASGQTWLHGHVRLR